MGDVGLVVDPGSADVHGRGVLDHAFFLGVAVEADHRAQPATDRGAGLAAVLEITGEALDVDSMDVEQALVVLPTPGGELAQIECVRLASEASVAGQEAEQRGLLDVGQNRRLIALDSGRSEHGHGRALLGRGRRPDHGAASTPGRLRPAKLRPPHGSHWQQGDAVMHRRSGRRLRRSVLTFGSVVLCGYGNR